MTLEERLKEDGVGMRWLRTAATTVTVVAAAMGIVWGVVWWSVGPRVNDWAKDLVREATSEMRAEATNTRNWLKNLEGVVERLEQNVKVLDEAVSRSTAPSWEFDSKTTTISDGEIGGRVVIRASGYKLRECGVPRVDVYFQNGGGIFHRFEDVSLLGPDSRGIAFSVDPDRLQQITYTARIPSDDEVRPGRGHGFIAVTYPDGCPAVEEAVAGPLQFRILPDG